MDSSSSFASQLPPRFDHTACYSFETCKDVDVVSELPGCSTSRTADSHMVTKSTLQNLPLFDPITFTQEDYEVDYASGNGNNLSFFSSHFEFHKAERPTQRVPLAPPFSKTAPSKWDDALKWISSPNSNRSKNNMTSQSQVGQGGRKATNFPVVVQVLDPRSACNEDPYTKRIDYSQANKDKEADAVVSWGTLQYTLPESYGKQAVVIEKSMGEPAVSLSQHDSSVSTQTATAYVPPPTTAISVSMRDMGTEMTPAASQDPSRIGTPVKDMSPIRSPTSSRPSSPTRIPPSIAAVDPAINFLDPNREELSEKEIQMKTRKEIMVLGAKLGKMSIAAWASQQEDKEASCSLKNVVVEQHPKTMVEARAEAWQEAEKAKYMSRFEREEMKIQAWENHQKAKMEAEMRKIEVEIERIKAKAQDKLMNKHAAARHKAEEKRAAAETERYRKVAKAEQQANYIRKTGRIPSKFACCSCWFCFCCI